MTITWKPKIVPINISTKEGSVTAIRTDSADPDNPKTYNVPRAPLNDTAEEESVGDEILGKRQKDRNKTAAIAAFVDAIEGRLKTYLETNDNG